MRGRPRSVCATGTIPNLKRLTEGCRAAGMTIAYANHHTNEGGEYLSFRHPTPSHRRVNDLELFLKGSFGVEVHEDVKPQPGDLIAQEHWTSSGFAGTDLDMLLRQHGVSRVLVAGNRANTCIDATGRYAPLTPPAGARVERFDVNRHVDLDGYRAYLAALATEAVALRDNY